MVAFPDVLVGKNPAKFLSSNKTGEVNLLSTLKRAVLACLAAMFIATSVWIWADPIADGDFIMLMMRGGLSFGSFVMGLLSIYTLGSSMKIPEIQIDPKQRRMSVTELDSRGRAKYTTHYMLDALAEITLRDNMLSARDISGRQVALVPVHDAQVEKAIREILAA